MRLLPLLLLFVVFVLFCFDVCHYSGLYRVVFHLTVNYICTHVGKFLGRSVFCVSVEVKLSVPLLSVCALPGKAVPEMIYTVSGGTLSSAHTLTADVW